MVVIRPRESPAALPPEKTTTWRCHCRRLAGITEPMIQTTLGNTTGTNRTRSSRRTDLGLQPERKRDGVDEQLDGTNGSKLQDPGEGKPWIQSEK
jgi:hypothetical protein